VKAKALRDFAIEVERRKSQGLVVDDAAYSGFLAPVRLQCQKCNCRFSTIGQHFLRGGGRCPACYPPRSYSRTSREAIRCISEHFSISFVSSLTGNEYAISKGKNIIKVDAYNAELNLILEYYGDLFHGNPAKFSPDSKCHPYDKSVTAQDLYVKTKDRELFILNAGYQLVTCWDSEWQSDPYAVLLRIGDAIEKCRQRSEGRA
jgi:hypothetical protein